LSTSGVEYEARRIRGQQYGLQTPSRRLIGPRRAWVDFVVGGRNITVSTTKACTKWKHARTTNDDCTSSYCC